MIPIRDNRVKQSFPLVTWTLVLLNVIVFLWDRHGNIFGPGYVFADLSMRPREVVASVFGRDDKFPLVTLFTSIFLHANLTHIVGNMIFLVVFGSGIEDALGSARFTVYYLIWGFVASATQIYVDPHSAVATVGASGAIGGVMGAYFLLFPGNKVEIFVPILAFLAFEVSAWILLGLWFLWQIFGHQEGVATWAHAGGFLAGMVTVLVLGGQKSILKARPDLENEF